MKAPSQMMRAHLRLVLPGWIGLGCLLPGVTLSRAAQALPAAQASAETASSDEEDAREAEAPALSPEIEALIASKQSEIAATRKEGIALLEAYLADSKPSPETAEALFKLAELTWEEAQASYLDHMGAYQDAVERCRADRAACTRVPARKPRLDLSRAQGTYQRLIREYPRYRKIDTVIYLYAFSLRDQGKLEEAVRHFYRLLQDYPRSRFRADAWMALGEYRFYERQDYAGALAAYEKVAKFPASPLYGLALFKSAWCYWKAGKTERAAQRFKDVLALAERAKDRSESEQKRAAELQDQALEYLVELFTEDDTKSAADAFEFMLQIGGKAYSLRVLNRLADTVFDQTRYERAAEAYLFLLKLDPAGANAPEHQIRVVESFQALGKNERAGAEMRKLVLSYGPNSEWARANRDRPNTLKRAHERAEEFIRVHAKSLHAAAQKNEKESKVVDRPLYEQVAEAYGFYLAQFPDAKDADELRYYRADILFFKLSDYRGAGDAYLALARRKPVGPHHKEALMQAMNAFEKLRPPPPRTAEEKRRRKVTEEDRRFAEAADLYAEILPDDKDIITVIYKNGQFFFDYGDYDEAVKRFGLILERYPDSELSGPAGDLILQSFGEARDYENIEHWARRLKKAKSFAGRAEQARLDGLIVGAMTKSAEQKAEAGQHDEAATAFIAVAKDFPRHEGAARALYNAGAAYEKAGKPEAAVGAYEKIDKQYPRAPQAPEALFIAAKIEESVADYDRAASLYERIGKSHARWERAPEALKNAGILRQTLGQHDRAAAHYAAYEKQHRGRPEAREVAFQIGVLMQEKKDHGRAAAAFADYARKYPGDERVIEALVHEGRAHLAAGADGKAEAALEQALAAYRRKGKARGDEERGARFAAEARYLQGELLFRQYEQVKIAGGPRQLARTLEKKATLLDEARKVYLDVVGYRVPEWATAALHRVGQGYALFARALRNTEVPRQLSEDEKTVYREELDRQVVVIEDKALDAFRTGYQKALEIGVFNAHTKALRDALAELDASAFPPEVETRTGPRLGEPTISLAPLEEIRRD